MGKVAWGLDLAGLSSTKQGLARATRCNNNKISIIVYKKHPFNNKVKDVEKNSLLIDKNIKRRIDFLKLINRHSPLYVDVPIDLQGLPNICGPTYTWELTMRPVDRMYKINNINALRPLGSDMGSSVSQFKYLIEISKLRLGYSVYETFPNASLYNIFRINFSSYKYKNGSFVLYNNNEWMPKEKNPDSAGDKVTDKDKKKRIDKYNKENNLSRYCNHLNLILNSNSKNKELDDNDYDAIVCALCGVIDKKHIYQAGELTKIINEYLHKQLKYDKLYYYAPKGYVILNGKWKCWPYNIDLKIENKLPL